MARHSATRAESARTATPPTTAPPTASQPTCQEDGKSLDAGIVCLNEDGDIPCQVDNDCPEDYNDGQTKSVFSYTCYKAYYRDDYGRCVENEEEKQCNKDNLKTDPFCIRCRQCIEAGINQNGDPCSVCKKSQTTEDCPCQASCDGTTWGGGNPWVSQSDPWCQGCLRCIREGINQNGDPCSTCKKDPLYENCDCNNRYPDCGSVEPVIAAVVPKRIAHTAGQSIRRAGGNGKGGGCPARRPCRYSGGRCGKLVGLGHNGNIRACPKRP